MNSHFIFLNHVFNVHLRSLEKEKKNSKKMKLQLRRQKRAALLHGINRTLCTMGKQLQFISKDVALQERRLHQEQRNKELVDFYSEHQLARKAVRQLETVENKTNRTFRIIDASKASTKK